MFNKMVLSLIVVGLMVIGFGSPALASHGCDSNSQMLAANPELKTMCGGLIGQEETGLQQRALAASAARYTGLAGIYTTGSDFLADNPELSVVGRYVPGELEETGLEQGLAASAARYKGLAGTYTIGSDFLADNPELSVAGRYVPAEIVTDDEPALAEQPTSQIDWQPLPWSNVPGR